jgi:hypothetical protein
VTSDSGPSAPRRGLLARAAAVVKGGTRRLAGRLPRFEMPMVWDKLPTAASR